MMLDMKPMVQINANYYKVKDLRILTENTFVLTLPKSRFKFIAGQHISLSIMGDYQSREYSIYSAEEGENLEVLVKEVEGGYFSPKLKHLKVGDMVEVHGPFGKFGLDEKKLNSHKHIFIASGTGIAPFHSMVKSIPGLDYTLLHGVRHAHEAYEMDVYERDRYILCTTADDDGDFKGRVTDYIKQHEFDADTICFFCGNFNMIKDAMALMEKKGIPPAQLHAEVYF